MTLTLTGEGAGAAPGHLRKNGVALIGAALFVAALWGAVQALPHVPWGVAAVLWIGLAVPVALVPAWSAAVRAGHSARLWQGRGRAWLFGGGVRVALAGVLALVITALLALRMADAPPLVWAVAAAAALAPALLVPWFSERFAVALAGPHAVRLALRAAVGASVAVALVVHAVLAWAVLPLPAPSPGPVAASPLLAEGLALARLWVGLEGFALGRLAEFGDLGRWAAAALAVAGQIGVYGALALAGAAATLDPREAARALAPATDADLPPAPGRAGMGVAGAIVLATLAATALADRQLSEMAPGLRPAAQVQVAAERIGDALYRAGTFEQVETLRAVALAQDADATARLGAALDAGFDAMAGNVDLFLDGYYTLWADYLRFFAWATGGLEAHLATRLRAALDTGAPFAGFDAARAEELIAAATRHASLAAQEAAVLADARIDTDANPARVRLTASHAALPDLAAVFQADAERAHLRWTAATGAGLLAGVMASRVASRLAARGVLRGAARMLGRVAGLAVALGADYALVRLDELQNRAAFRAEILAEIERLRAEGHAALGHVAPVGDQR